jgi:type II secretory pathway component HofQ
MSIRKYLVYSYWWLEQAPCWKQKVTKMFGLAKITPMQSENTSKTTRKSAKAKTLETVETPKAEVVQKKRATKSSPMKSSASKTSAASPKHHHSAAPEKVKAVKPIALAEIAAEATTVIEEREIGHEDIARLAHSFWVARNYAPGSPDEDWLRAEKELAVK